MTDDYGPGEPWQDDATATSTRVALGTRSSAWRRRRKRCADRCGRRFGRPRHRPTGRRCFAGRHAWAEDIGGGPDDTTTRHGDDVVSAPYGAARSRRESLCEDGRGPCGRRGTALAANRRHDDERRIDLDDNGSPDHHDHDSPFADHHDRADDDNDDRSSYDHNHGGRRDQHHRRRAAAHGVGAARTAPARTAPDHRRVAASGPEREPRAGPLESRRTEWRRVAPTTTRLPLTPRAAPRSRVVSAGRGALDVLRGGASPTRGPAGSHRTAGAVRAHRACVRTQRPARA